MSKPRKSRTPAIVPQLVAQLPWRHNYPMPANSNKSSLRWRCQMKNKNINAQALELEQTIAANVAGILGA
jgi:hypothetical protein